MMYGIKPLVTGGPFVCLPMNENTMWDAARDGDLITLDHEAIKANWKAYPTTRTYFGTIVGDGLGNGAWGMLRTRYLMVTRMRVGALMTADPEMIEASLPDLDNVIAVPFMAQYRVPPGDSGMSVSWRERVVHTAARTAEMNFKQEDFLAEDFGVYGNGSGVEMVPADLMPEEMFAEEVMRFERT